ncbi:peptide-n-n-acetyl-beta-glucosaminyl-asparagine amidase isoform x1 [Lasius niger]|uniref:Peptide-n-n-acetyl-beta-glucosaminyl-asparagine amidase isoform x1 n=1 Tax=Lasius niger TaxID=67767 RepID=A0A0J7KJD9_LASNI|nr:peptide-n-n-acetyl-beta-glucosaminyl-asparagine amidase isoform x1 [Lasius niger]
MFICSFFFNGKYNINLKDSETGLLYPVKVTPEELVRMQNGAENAGIEAIPEFAKYRLEGSPKSTEINFSTLPESAKTNENNPPSNAHGFTTGREAFYGACGHRLFLQAKEN